ncbi:MAG: DUF6599 family protein [Phycisphaerae bacterium]
MPTLFARRYMRGSPGRTERLIGGACLLIAVAAVVGFARYATTSRPGFFSVDPSNEPPAIAPEIKHARSLLPDAPAPGWVRVEPAEAVAADGRRGSSPPLPGAVGRSAAAAVRGRYQSRVDARQQLAVRIFDPPSAARWALLFDSLRPADAAGEPLGVRGWKGRSGEVGFQSGRYYSSIVATNLPADATLTPALLAREVADRQVAFDAFAPAAAATQPASGGRTAPASAAALPTPAGTAWAAPRDVARYNPGNLWEKIDGRAEAYLALDFVEMTFGTFAHSGGGTVDCFVYRMAEPVKAFGIYHSEQSGQPEAVAVGKEGYRGKGSLFFWKGTSYVQLVASEGATIPPADWLTLAQSLAETIPDGGAKLWAEEAMPRDGQVAGSFTYLGKNALSLDFLENVFTADYERGPAHFTLFVTENKDVSQARALFDQYAAYVGGSGKVVRRSDAADGPELVAEISGEFDIIFVKGRYFGGANAASEAAAAESAVKQLRDALK